ncbi:MAG: autotransporter-associated beta strand repeat-containing protein [Opitutaceae bacterium]|jgi:autotransporter-associated beta strand protein|nr:autotransporter-associated beta strand repeat-containing protein [Opitutaceae bacterium]
MNPNPNNTPKHPLRHPIAARLLACCLALALPAPAMLAADGTWTSVGSSGNWTAAGSWLDGIIADGAGAHADFSQANTASAGFRAVALSANVTLGRLTLGDSTGANRGAWQLNASGAGALTFDNNGAAASLFLGPGNSAASRGVEINVPILLRDSLDIYYNAATGVAPVISGAISASSAGLKTITNKGAGALAVSLNGIISDGDGTVALEQNSATSNLTLGNANTYSGGTELRAGALTIGADNRLGAASGAVAFSGGTLTFASGAVGVVSNRATTINAGGGAFQLNSAAGVDWQGAITGAGALAKLGTGTLALTGVNDYGGGTVIEAGVLTGHSRSLQGNMTNNAALIFNQDFNGAFSGALTGAGALSKTGAGALSFSNNNSAFTGTTTINAGGLFHAGAAAALGGDVVVATSATFGGAGALGASLAAAGATIRVGLDDPAATGAQTLAVAGTLSLADTRLEFDLYNDGITAAADRLDAGTLADGGGNIIYIGLFKSGTFNLGAGLGALHDTATLFVGGAQYRPGGRSTAVLSDAAGALQIETSAGASLALVWTGLAGGAWAATGSNWSGVDDGLFINGDRVTFDDSATGAGAREVTVDAGGAVVSDMIVDGAGNYIFTGGGILADHTQAEGALAGAGAGKLIKQNTGTLALRNGANDFKGGVELRAGVLALGAGASLGTGTVAVFADGLAIRAEGAVSLAGAFALGAHDLQLDTLGNDIALAGNIAGAGVIYKTGTGALALSGSSTHGGVSLSAGSLVAGHAAALGSVVTVTGAGVTVALNATGTVATAFNFGAHGMTLAGETAGAGATLSGALAGSGAVYKTGAGAITLAGANPAFTGSVAVNEGALYIATPAALGAGAGAAGIAASATLGLVQPAAAAGDVLFTRPLAGAGVFSVSLGGGEKNFRLGAGAGAAFTGTVAMVRGIMQLDATTVAELAGAGLALGAGGAAGIAASGAIGALRLDGGTLKIAMSGGAPAHLLAVENLDVVSGTIAADLPAPGAGDIINPPVPPNPGLFDLDMTTDTRLLAAASVTGAGVSLALVRPDGSPLASSATATVTQSGVPVAKAVYNYTAAVTGSGIYLASGIARLDVLGGRSLVISNSGAPKSALAAQITGAGGIDVRADGAITLLDTGNDFTGAAVITTGTLRAAGAGALATASAVGIAAGAEFDTGGFNQTVSNLAGAGDVALGAAVLTINSGADTEFFGNIKAGAGGGVIKTGAGTLTLGGANRNAALAINQGRVRATSAGAIGAGAVTLAGGAALAFDGVSGMINNPIAGAGAALEFANGSNARLGGANTLAQLNILGDSRVTAAGAGALGGPAANVFVEAGSELVAGAPGVQAGSMVLDGGALVFGAAGAGIGSFVVTGTVSFSGGAALRVDGVVPGGVYDVLQAGALAGDFVYDKVQNGAAISFASDGAGGLRLTALNQAVEPARDIAMTLDTIFAVRDALAARAGEAFLQPLVERGRDAANDFWLSGVRAESDYDAGAGHIGHKVDVHGALVGYDRVTRTGAGLLGFYGGVARGADVADNNARSNTDTTTVGVYGVANLAPFYISADVSFGWLDTTGRRAEGAGTVRSDCKGDYQSLGLETGFVWKAGPKFIVRPSLGIQGVSVRQDGRAETGAGAMRVEGFRHNTVQGWAGVRGTQRFALFGRACAFDFSAGRRFDMATDSGTVGATFAAGDGGGDVRFALRTGGYARGSVSAGAGFRAALWNDVFAGLFYNYEGGGGAERQSFGTAVRWLW